MALNSEQIALLLKMIQNTHEVELTCRDCLDELDQYTQRTLDAEPLEGMLERVRAHLEECSSCNDQFKMVLETLKAIEES